MNTNQFNEQKQPSANVLENLNDIRVNQETEIFQQCDLILQQFMCFTSQSLQKPRAYVFRNNKQSLLEIFAVQLIQLIVKQFQQKYRSSSANDQIKFSETIFELVEKPQFELMLPKKDSPLYGQSQQCLKDIILQFIIYAGNQCISETSSSLISKHPLIIQIFVCMLRQLLTLGDVCQTYDDDLNMEYTYDFLASYFGIEIYIDIQTNSAYFPKLGTYVYEQNPSLVYMIRTNNLEKKSKSLAQSLIENDSDISEEYSQIDAEEFSNILNSKEDGQGQDGLGNEVNIVVSNIDIGDPTRQINKVESTYKIAESEIIASEFADEFADEVVRNEDFRENERRKHKDNDKDMNEQNEGKVSITTTYSSFRKKSSNLCKQNIKIYIESSSLLRSELFDTKIINQGLNSLNGNNEYQNLRAQNYSNQYCSKCSNSLFDKQNMLPFTTPQQAKAEVTIKRNVKQSPKQSDMQANSGSLKQFYQQTSQTFFGEDSYHNSRQNNECQIFYTPKFKSTQASSLIETLNSKEKFTKITPWINSNISKQFTNSFILQKMPEPYRSSIQMKKTRAREERRRAYQLLNF